MDQSGEPPAPPPVQIPPQGTSQPPTQLPMGAFLAQLGPMGMPPGLHPALAALQQPGMPGGSFPPGALVGLPPPRQTAFPQGSQPQTAFFLPGFAAQLAAASPPPRVKQSRPNSRGPRATASRKQCNCKNSRCLKLYCECFASGVYCDNCNCKDCCNNRANEEVRQGAVEAVLDRNPNAFRPKVAGTIDDVAAPARHNKGCNCKKSGCLKKYCECFQAGATCGENCKCVDCKNFEGSAARVLVVAQAARNKQSRYNVTQGGPGALPAMLNGGSGMSPLPAHVKQEAPGGSNTSLTQTHRQQAAKDVLRDVMQPEVVEKLATLLMIISAEEAERRAAAERAVLASGAAPTPEPPPSTQPAPANQPRPGLYEEQERLVLTEFRDALKTITRVVSEKVEKKASAAAATQNVVAAVLAAQQAHTQQPQAAQAVHTAQAAQAQVPQLQAQLRAQLPAGLQAVYTMRGGQPQLVFVPQAFMAAATAANPAQQAGPQHPSSPLRGVVPPNVVPPVEQDPQNLAISPGPPGGPAGL